MNIVFWGLEAFLFLMGLVCIKAIYFPEAHARWTLERTQAELKFYGFEGSITTTERSVRIIRYGHIAMLLVIMVLMVILRFTLG